MKTIFNSIHNIFYFLKNTSIILQHNQIYLLNQLHPFTKKIFFNDIYINT